LTLPFFGSLGDVYNPKKFLIGSTYIACGSLIAMLGTNRPDFFWVVGVLAILANVGYGVTSIFYNASLLYVAEPSEADDVSSRGFAVGYIGSVSFLILSMIIYMRNPTIPTTVVLIALTGGWWIVWSIIPFLFVTSTTRREGTENVASSRGKYREGNIFARAARKFGSAIRILAKTKQTALFLAASALYNDGISTIGSHAAVYATSVMHVEQSQLLLVNLTGNGSAILGALLGNMIAKKLGTKVAILLGIVLYVVVAIYSYFIRYTWELWIVGVLIGLGLGSTQSLSRSLLAVMIPQNFESEIFSFYELTVRGTSWIGPLVYGAITSAYVNNQRPAMVSMVMFLVSGAILLIFVNVELAIDQAANCQNDLVVDEGYSLTAPIPHRQDESLIARK